MEYNIFYLVRFFYLNVFWIIIYDFLRRCLNYCCLNVILLRNIFGNKLVVREDFLKNSLYLIIFIFFCFRYLVFILMFLLVLVRYLLEC